MLPINKSIRVRYPDIRSILKFFDEPRTHGIMQYVIRLLAETFILPQSVIKEIFLPADFLTRGQPSFSIANHWRKRRNIGEAQEKVDMIWHEQSQMTKPLLFFVIVTNGVQSFGANLLATKLIGSTWICANRDEERCIVLNPEWCFVIQRDMERLFHPGIDLRLIWVNNKTEPVARRSTATGYAFGGGFRIDK